MSNEPPEHLHLLSSFELGWDSLNLIYELEPADEMPESDFGKHLIVIAENNFRASYMLDGCWQNVDYAKGDISIIPATRTFPRTQIDREVPLIELFLEPFVLTRTAGEYIDIDNIELGTHLQINDPLIQHMGLALKQELETPNGDSFFYAESMAIALSAHLLKRYCSRLVQNQEYVGTLAKYKLKEAVDYIHENLDKKLTLGEIAVAVNMSPHYFATLFKQSTGITPHQYVVRCRIEKAKKLLSKKELSLVEICQQVGFENQSHFTRVFRQHTAKTPKAYRDAIF
jgi:AraC family transcriptional regulator